MTAARIAELETEVAGLKSRLRAAGLMPPPADLPDDDQLDALIEIALSAHEKLQPPPAEAPTYRRHFANAVTYFAFAHRLDRLNSKHALSMHVDAAAAFLRRFNIDGGVSLRPLVAAAVVSNIKFSPLNRLPFDLEIAVDPMSDVSQPSSAWRDVLSSGKAPEPTPLARPLLHARPREIMVAERVGVITS